MEMVMVGQGDDCETGETEGMVGVRVHGLAVTVLMEGL